MSTRPWRVELADLAEVVDAIEETELGRMGRRHRAELLLRISSHTGIG